MFFLSPLFLVAGLAAALPIALHLLKRHPDALVKFSAVRLLQSAPVEHARQRHLRELILLALRVAALCLLALAFARPFLASSAAVASAGALVVALDTSLSMSAPGQFETARALARRAVESGSPVAVVTFADDVRVASALSGDRQLARAAIDTASPGAGAARYRAALAVAVDLLHGRTGTILVVTDLQASGWDAGDRAPVPEGIQVEVADVGPPPANLAVTSVRLAGDRVVATIRRSGAAAADAHVVLSVGADETGTGPTRQAAETTVPLGAGQTLDVTFPVPDGRWAAVSVDDRDGAAADNVRYLVLDAAARPRILLVTAGGDPAHDAFYVTQALAAVAPGAASYEAEGVAGSALQAWDQARVDAHSAIVLLSTRGLEHHGRALISDYVRKGGGLLVAAGADVDGEVLTESLGGLKVSVLPPAAGTGPARTLATVDSRHPLFRGFSGQSSLGLVKFQRVTTVRADTCDTLARFTTGEAGLLDCEPGAGRALILASDLDNRWNDFPRHATFLPFVHEAIRYLSSVRRSAEYVVGAVPPGVPAVPGVTLTPGFGAQTAQLAAINVDPAESDPSRLTVAEFQTAVARGEATEASVPRRAAAEQEDRQHLWQYALAFMMAVLALESILATRAA